MEPTIFTRIIKGEIPCHKVYEDDKTIVFLDIHPSVPGHALVVSKEQIDRLEDLPDEDFDAMMSTMRKVMRRVVEVFGQDYKACVKREGFGVPHAHLHVLPCRSMADFTAPQDLEAEPDHDALAALAKKLVF
jgi:histidine triad (HIT) family protein